MEKPPTDQIETAQVISLASRRPESEFSNQLRRIQERLERVNQRMAELKKHAQPVIWEEF